MLAISTLSLLYFSHLFHLSHLLLIVGADAVVSFPKYCQGLLQAIESEHAARCHEGGEGETERKQRETGGRIEK
jgi:hypothetical protein